MSLRPWDINKHKHPRIWIKENWEIVDRFVEYLGSATKLHSPVINWREAPPAFHFFDQRVTSITALTQYLRVRSMHKLFEGDLDGAESDLLACRKIARLLYESKRLHYVIHPANRSLRNAIEGEFQLCMSPKYDAKRLTAYRQKASAIRIDREPDLPVNYEMRIERIVHVLQARENRAQIFFRKFLSEKAAENVKRHNGLERFACTVQQAS